MARNHIGMNTAENGISERSSSSSSSPAYTTAETKTLEAIAIVGMATGFPQEVDSPESLWQLMLDKRSTATKFPEERMNIDAMYHPDPGRRSQIPVARAHFLKHDLATFDAPFFTISSADAASMDPQQRLLLEHTYLALENAGIPLERLSGSKTSVYTGSFSNDWQYLTFRDGEECATTSALGSTGSFNANRISWFFNLKGNSANVDTACSSSLVCIDFACQGLRSGVEDMSIVAGSNVMLSPDNMHSLTNLNMLSVDGECYSFDHRGNGYSRGEGVGVLILKRLTDAIRDGDTIRGIIRNSGCSQDGRTPGITLPNADSQAELIRRCYRQANLSMEPVRFFEAHGTGTPVGDPIEASGIGSVFRHVRSHDDPLWVGAVKANVGHLEGASGIAGVIKAALVLERGLIPPNNNFEKLNSNIDADFLNIRFPTMAIPWPTSGLRRASVNSFGNGGTNAHIILDDVFHFLSERQLTANHLTVRDPEVEAASRCDESDSSLAAIHSSAEIVEQDISPRLIVLSAADQDGCKRQADKYTAYFSRPGTFHLLQQNYLNDFAYTLSHRRSQLAWRSFAVIESTKDLTQLDKSVSKARSAISSPGIGFVFTGQGAQWAGMGRELMSFPSFEKSLLRSDEILHSFGCSWNLRTEILYGDNARISLPQVAQPLCTAIQVALIDLLKSCRVFPTCVVGHSSGEIAAAYCVGALTADSAMKAAYYRGQLAGALAENEKVKTSMMSVQLSEADVMPYINQEASHSGEKSHPVVVACVNSPSNVTLSGKEHQLDALKTVFDADDIFCRRLAVQVAYHSPYMLAISEAYRRQISPLHRDDAPEKTIPMFSSVTGDQVSFDSLSDPEYWVQNMVSPVKFVDAVSAMCSRKARNAVKKLDLSHRKLFALDMLVEIGPHSALQRPVRAILETLTGTAQISYSSCLERNNSATTSFLKTIGQIYCLGGDVCFFCVNRHTEDFQGMALSDLPGYAFDRSKKYWNESRISAQYRKNAQPRLDLLGKPVADWNPHEPRWRNHLRAAEMPWIEHHVINGSGIYPGAGMLVMAIEAMRQTADRGRSVEGIELEQVSFLRSIPIDQSSEGIEIQVSLQRRESGQNLISPWYDFHIYGYVQGSWQEHCCGLVRPRYREPINDAEFDAESGQHLQGLVQKFDQCVKSCNTTLEPDALYDAYTHNNGMIFGPSFRRILSGHYDEQARVIAEVEMYQWPDEEHPQDHVIHPTTLDALFQVATSGYAKGGHRVIDAMIPTYIGHLFVRLEGLMSHSRATLHACAWLMHETKRAAIYAGFALDKDKSTVLAEFEDLRLTSIAKSEHGEIEEYSENDHVAFEVRHAADVDYLTPEETMAICTKSPGPSLCSWLNLLCHKKAKLEILEIGFGGRNVYNELLHHLTAPSDSEKIASTKYHRFHYMSAAPELSQEDKQNLACFSRTTFTQADITKHNELFDMDDTYDVIIAPRTIGDDNTAISNIKRMLKADGSLALHGRTIETNSGALADPTSSLLIRSGFSEPTMRFSLEDHMFDIRSIDNKTLIASKAPISLIYDAASITQQKFCDDMATFLSSKGISNNKISLSEATQAVDTGSTYIVALELDTPFLYSISEDTFHLLKAFFLTAKDVVWVNYQGGSTASKPEYSMIYGMARVIQRERHDIQITVMSLDVQEVLSEKQIERILHVASQHTQPRIGRETEYLESDGVFNVPRIAFAKTTNGDLCTRSQAQVNKSGLIKDAPNLCLSIGTVGLLDSLRFTEDEAHPIALAADQVEIKVKAIGLNYIDCLVALGRSQSTSVGQECAGIVTRAGSDSGHSVGDHVVILAGNTFRTYARGSKLQTLRIPDSMPFTTAAALPAQFATAWEAVHRLARLGKGESILVHAGAGGTGQAAIQVAKLFDAQIFATVSSETKRRLLIDLYQIPTDHIFYSRDISFARQLKRMTNGRGVDVIITSLPGDLGLAAWDCIAPYGRIIDIAHRDKPVSLPLSDSLRNVSFMAFDRVQFQTDHPAATYDVLKTTFDMIAEGKFQAAHPLQIYDISDAGKAFHDLTDGKLAGKAVLEIRDEASVDMIVNNKPTFRLSSDATYVIAGGFGGLGRATARWMARRGARNIILLSRNGPKTRESKELIAELQKQGIQVKCPSCDISNMSQMKDMLDRSSKDMPAIKGCVQATMVRKDCLLEDLTFDMWDVAVRCKTVGTWNLHTLLPPGMDFFVLLSSASGLTGIRGQINYNVGNCYEDAFARYRVQALGERATSFDLGAMRDDGLLAENPELMKRALGYGVLKPISRSMYYALLDRYCDPGQSDTSTSLQGMTGAKEDQIAIGLGLGVGDGLESFDYASHPMMYPLQVLGEWLQPTTGPSARSMDSKNQFAATNSLDEAAEVVTQAILSKLRKSLAAMADGLDGDVHLPLQMYGVDSLLAVELRNWLSKEFVAEVAVFEAQGASTTATLSFLVAKRSKINHPSWS